MKDSALPLFPRQDALLRPVADNARGEQRAVTMGEGKVSFAEGPRLLPGEGGAARVPEKAHQLFEVQVLRRPAAVAIEEGARRVSYGELNAWANRLARRLVQLGAREGQCVGILAERSIEYVAGVLAILKVGCAYLPLDTGNPAPRLQQMLAETQATLVVGRGVAEPWMPETTRAVSWQPKELEGLDASNLPPTSHALAYVMFTSGSTGTPKGAEIPHVGVTRLVVETDYIDFSENDVVALAANPAFDASTFEIWGALLNGGRLVVVEKETLLSPYRLMELLREKAVTVLFLTTPLFHQLARATPPAFGGLRYLVVGGDALDPSAARLVLESRNPPQHLINGYGPTEATTFAICHRVTEAPHGAPRIPIGRPIAFTTAHLLDAEMQPVAPGAMGELYLGGPRLAHGYVADAKLTAERFIETAFGRLYKTGDIAQRLPDGTLDFLGRQDEQTKFRGYRIELSEIEAAIRKVTRVGECKVLVREVAPGQRQLLAYMTRQGGRPLPGGVLRAELGRLLPEYMVPSAFFEVALFPLTANGKIDVAKLPLAQEGVSEEAQLIESQNTLHSQLVEIWQEVLDRRPVGIRDDFFECGGHSLLAMRMLGIVEERLGVRPEIATLFEKATIEHLAESLLLARRSEAAEQPYIALHAEGKQTPFFFLHGDFVGGGFFSRGLARELGEDRPFYAVHPHGLQGDRPPRSIAVMAAERLAAIRKIQPHGPYLLGGYCNGALVAFEIARRLEAEGERVPVVVLFMASGAAYRNRAWRWLAAVTSTLLREDRAQQDQRFLKWSRWGRFAAASLRHHLAAGRAVLRQPVPEQARRFVGKARRILSRATGSSVRKSDAVPATLPASQENEFWALYHDASEAYVPQPFAGKLALLWPQDEPVYGASEPAYGWKSVCPQVELVYVPGDHDSSITCDANLAVAGAAMRRALEQAENRGAAEHSTR